jgi:hypothetical protein
MFEKKFEEKENNKVTDHSDQDLEIKKIQLELVDAQESIQIAKAESEKAKESLEKLKKESESRTEHLNSEVQSSFQIHLEKVQCLLTSELT